MRRVVATIFVALMSSPSVCAEPPVVAKSTPSKQQVNEAIQSAERMQKISEFLAIAGIAFVVLSIPVAIYWDRCKKASKRASEHSPDRDHRRREDESAE